MSRALSRLFSKQDTFVQLLNQSNRLHNLIAARFSLVGDIEHWSYTIYDVNGKGFWIEALFFLSLWFNVHFPFDCATDMTLRSNLRMKPLLLYRSNNLLWSFFLEITEDEKNLIPCDRYLRLTNFVYECNSTPVIVIGKERPKK